MKKLHLVSEPQIYTRRTICSDEDIGMMWGIHLWLCNIVWHRKTRMQHSLPRYAAILADANVQIDIPPPTIWKFVRLWTRRQIFSILACGLTRNPNPLPCRICYDISGREVLVDTAVKTAETGSMQRRPMNV